MNLEQLDMLMADSTKQFNELKVEEGTVQTRLTQIDTALKQLQGEYEAYKTMRAMLVAQSSEPVDEATVTPDPFKKKSKEPVDAAK